MKRLAQIFQEDNGQFSSMRVYSFIALGIAAVLSFKAAPFETQVLWVVAAFAPKAVQKFAETKKPAQ